tara:strand:- start:21 stop:200 length:180 start_codon:yes stop_codon:yes gene_type:complete
VDWELENENLKLKDMITIYEQEIKKLEQENEDLEKEVLILKQRLRYYKLDDGEEADGIE